MESNQITESNQSVGDIMKDSHQKALKTLVILAGVGVYLAGVVYAEVHGLNILSKGVDPDFLVWAYLGMIALGVSAVALPLALHVWTFEAMHRIAALVFYAVDIALLGVNSFVDFGVNAGETLPPWALMYKEFIMPATPVIAAVGWCVLFLLDPSARAMILKYTLQASIRTSLSQQIIEAAKGSDVSAAVGAAARAEVNDALSGLFGKSVIVKEATSGPIAQLQTVSYSHLYPPNGDRQNVDFLLARMPSDEWQKLNQAWKDYDAKRAAEIVTPGPESQTVNP